MFLLEMLRPDLIRKGCCQYRNVDSMYVYMDRGKKIEHNSTEQMYHVCTMMRAITRPIQNHPKLRHCVQWSLYGGKVPFTDPLVNKKKNIIS